MLSRVADSLYWMSRYLERAEHTARVVDVHLNLTLEDISGRTPAQRWARVLKGLHFEPAEDDATDYDLMQKITFDALHSQSITSSIGSARENARQIREQISSEMWTQINRLYLDMKRTRMDAVWNGQPNEFFAAVKDGSHLFQGITAATLIRGEGWYFIQLGRYMERTMSMIGLMDVQFSEGLPDSEFGLSMDHYVEWLAFLRSFTAFEAYCKVYGADVRPDRVVKFLLFNPEFPHTVRFCVQQMQEACSKIAAETQLHRNSKLQRLIGRLSSDLSYDEMDDVRENYHDYLTHIKEQCTQIHSCIYDTYIYRQIDATT
jgi:uncharacterized alpha-E superfamily protein